MNSKQRADNIFIVGTDTGVGKTVLSLIVMQFFFSRGYDPFYIKPVQTGCDDPYDTDSDANFIHRHAGFLQDRDPGDSVIYCFKNPKAPYFAALDERKTINLSVIKDAVNQRSRVYSPVIIEAAGGVLVPVTSNTCMVDMIILTQAKPVLAARAGLGTINHSLLTLEALKRRGLQPLGIVFIDAGTEQTPPEMVAENMSAIEKVSGVKVAGVIGRIDDFFRPLNDYFEPLTRIFDKGITAATFPP